YTGTLRFDDFSVTNLPPAPAATTEHFDTTPVGALPTGWTQASSTGSATFAVAAGQALSPANGLVVTASRSNASASAWLQAVQPADVQVGAAGYLNSLIPAELLA